jgi:hypothetical protein
VGRRLPGYPDDPGRPREGDDCLDRPHHDLARFQWYLGTPGAEPVAIGFDVAELADGKIAAVHGFLDKLPG